jgi:hypothetical protein
MATLQVRRNETCAGEVADLFEKLPFSIEEQHEAHAGSFHTRRHTAFPSGGAILPAPHDGVPLAIEEAESSNGDHLLPKVVGDERPPEDQ